MRPMRRTFVPLLLMAATATVIVTVTAGTARAERSLTLKEAVQLALGQEPLLAEARIAVDRSKLAVLRAQLDRVSVKVDASINELWNKTNIAGPTVSGCTGASSALGSFGDTACSFFGGTWGPASDQSPSSLQGLSNLKANINVPVFSGFAVEANVALKQRLEDVSTAALRDAKRQTALSVARAYWGVRRIGILRDAQRASAQRLGEAELVTSGRVLAGLAAPIDHNRAVLTRLQRLEIGRAHV